MLPQRHEAHTYMQVDPSYGLILTLSTFYLNCYSKTVESILPKVLGAIKILVAIIIYQQQVRS